ncbi:MAG: hypothetical protein PVI20_01885 [Desulfobacteraceae bacterium]|jgi:hypothetical protein
MDKETKKELKRMARDTEIRVTQSILRWKYKKDGKQAPEDPELKSQSQSLTDQAHQIISRRGKNIWKELKKVYRKKEK